MKILLVNFYKFNNYGIKWKQNMKISKNKDKWRKGKSNGYEIML